MSDPKAPVPSADPGLLSTRQLNHRDRPVTDEIHGLLAFAFAQEAALLQVGQSAPPPMSADDIGASGHCFIGASRGDRLLGCVSLQPDDEPGQINVALLLVHPACQRQGIGRALMKHVLRQGPGMVFSVVCGARNAPVLALCQALGFAEYRRGSLGPQALEVVKLRVRAEGERRA